MRAIAIFADDRPAAIIGIARENWTARFFSEHKPELKPYLKTVIIMRAVKAAMELVKRYPTDVYARAEHPEGCRILTRLGFEQVTDDGVFVWDRCSKQ